MDHCARRIPIPEPRGPLLAQHAQLRLGNLPHAPRRAAGGRQLRTMFLLILCRLPVPEFTILRGVFRIGHRLTLTHDSFIYLESAAIPSEWASPRGRAIDGRAAASADKLQPRIQVKATVLVQAGWLLESKPL